MVLFCAVALLPLSANTCGEPEGTPANASSLPS
jgi:hypothetical protein